MTHLKTTLVGLLGLFAGHSAQAQFSFEMVDTHYLLGAETPLLVPSPSVTTWTCPLGGQAFEHARLVAGSGTKEVVFEGRLGSAEALAAACDQLLSCPSAAPMPLDGCFLQSPAQSRYGRLATPMLQAVAVSNPISDESEGLRMEIAFDDQIRIESPTPLVLTFPVTLTGEVTATPTMSPPSTGRSWTRAIVAVVGTINGLRSSHIFNFGNEFDPSLPAQLPDGRLDETCEFQFMVPAGSTTIDVLLESSIEVGAYAEALGLGSTPPIARVRAMLPEGIQFKRLRPAAGGPLPPGFRAVSVNTGRVYEEGSCGGQSARFCSQAPNSTGASGSISVSGSALLGAQNLRLSGAGLPPGTFGLFVYGDGTGTLPLASGPLCVGSAPRRLGDPAMASSTGELTRSVDFQAPPLSLPYGQIDPGVPYSFQLWFRDAGASAGSGLTDAVAITFCP